MLIRNFTLDIVLTDQSKFRQQFGNSFGRDVYGQNPSKYQDGTLYTYLSFSNKLFNNDFSGLYISCFGYLCSLVHSNGDKWLSKKDVIVDLCLDGGFLYIDHELLDEMEYLGPHDLMVGKSWWERYFSTDI